MALVMRISDFLMTFFFSLLMSFILDALFLRNTPQEQEERAEGEEKDWSGVSTYYFCRGHGGADGISVFRIFSATFHSSCSVIFER